MPGQALASLHSDNSLHRRQAERFAVNRAGRILSVNPSLSGISVRSCHLADISRFGATLNLVTTIGLPDHYYLNIVGTAYRIGCAEVHRLGNRVGVKFIKEIDEDLLHAIIRGDFLSGAI
jgi:hypothetical protein